MRKVTFAEAEKADDVYWANATKEERFNELANLRMIVLGYQKMRMEKIIVKRSLHERAD
ncbi:MAG: hypothetical protein ACTHLE_13640 [Agriterribacter sp.]